MVRQRIGLSGGLTATVTAIWTDDQRRWRPSGGSGAAIRGTAWRGDGAGAGRCRGSGCGRTRPVDERSSGHGRDDPFINHPSANGSGNRRHTAIRHATEHPSRRSSHQPSIAIRRLYAPPHGNRDGNPGALQPTRIVYVYSPLPQYDLVTKGLCVMFSPALRRTRDIDLLPAGQ